MPRRLSRRERQVMRGIAGGQTSKEIAALLGIAPSTVDWHVANALAKLQAANRAEGVATALHRGELGQGPWRIRRAIPHDGPLWRIAAAAVVALLVPIIVASDVRERPSPAGPDVAPSTSAPTLAPVPVPELASAAPPVSAAPSMSPAPVSAPPSTAAPPAPAVTAPAVTAAPRIATPLPTAAPVATAPALLTVAPAVSLVPLTTASVAPALPPPPTAPLPVPPLPTVGPLPTALPSASLPPLP